MLRCPEVVWYSPDQKYWLKAVKAAIEARIPSKTTPHSNTLSDFNQTGHTFTLTKPFITQTTFSTPIKAKPQAPSRSDQVWPKPIVLSYQSSKSKRDPTQADPFWLSLHLSFYTFLLKYKTLRQNSPCLKIINKGKRLILP